MLAPLALVAARAPPARRRGADPQHHLRRGRRALRELGRLRLVEGGARRRSPRCSAPSSPDSASTPSTRATCARRCTRRRFPARTSPTGRRPRRACPGSAADRRRARRAAATVPRPRRGVGVSALATSICTPGSRPTSRLRRAALGRDDVRLLVSSRRDCRSSTRRFRDLPQFLAPATWSSSTPPRRFRPPFPRRARTARSSSCGSRRPRPTRTRALLGRRASPRRRAVRRRPGRRAARAPRRRRRLGSSRPYAGVRAVARASRPAAAARGLPGGARAADPVRLRAAALAARRVPERLRGRARQRRDGERRPAVHDRADHRARRAAACSSRRSPCTPASRRRSATSRPYPERYRVPAETARLVNAVARAGAGA